jgi:hypothetical protein
VRITVLDRAGTIERNSRLRGDPGYVYISAPQEAQELVDVFLSDEAGTAT